MSRDDTRRRWLEQLTGLPSVAGREGAAVDWVTKWVNRRSDLAMARDRVGNLYLTQTRPLRSEPIWLTAHLDHPGFLVTDLEGPSVMWEFRGGVKSAYFDGAFIEWLGGGRSRIESAVATDLGHRGTSRLVRGHAAPAIGDIGRWYVAPGKLGVRGDRLRAHACDDLAGVAAALAVLDAARGRDDLAALGVILTRAEEVGFAGAIAAARSNRIPHGSRIVCLEMSRQLPDAPIGGGPIVRVGDASSVFDPGLTNALATLARSFAEETGAVIQRKLMTGGSCEATAFLAYGHRASCVCLPLGNYHNMGNLDQVEAGGGGAVPAPEEISLTDWDTMVELLLYALPQLDEGAEAIRRRLDDHFDTVASIL